jgi:hypothetical protein
MSGGIDRLTTKAIESFIKQTRAGTATTKRLSDGGALFVMITPTGSVVWRIKYRLNGKEKTYSPGVYPEVGLAGRGWRALRSAG